MTAIKLTTPLKIDENYPKNIKRYCFFCKKVTSFGVCPICWQRFCLAHAYEDTDGDWKSGYHTYLTHHNCPSFRPGVGGKEMKLSEEQIGAIINAHPEEANEVYPCPDGGQIHTTCHYQAILEAQLSALASTPDEKLLLTSDEKTKIAPYSNAQFPILIMNITKAQLAKVQPVITALRAKLAEAEKERQEAIKVNNASWEGRLQGKIDYAVEQERQRIMKIFASFGKIKLKKPLSGKEFEALFERGESLEVKHDK